MKRFSLALFAPPLREYCITALVLGALAVDVFAGRGMRDLPFLLLVSLAGALPTLWLGAMDAVKGRITIDVFNAIALVIAFAANELRSAAFIVLMLAFARLLDWHTERRTHNALEELLKLKPATALVERDGEISEVGTASVKAGERVIVKDGARVPVDGIVVSGSASINESSVTGESALITKTVGDAVTSLTLNESGTITLRATRVGKDSTSERMAELMREAAKRKSSPEKMADRFARIFLPVVGVIGLATYVVTRSITMTAALFLVACADDMAVAIPLAMTASFGAAAKRGMIVRGGGAMSALAGLRSLVFDKTGTLTYGKLAVKETVIAPRVNKALFWKMVAVGEKFSEHPIAKAIFREAAKNRAKGDAAIPDPDEFTIHKGSGIWARIGKNEIAIGDDSLFAELRMKVPKAVHEEIERKEAEGRVTAIPVFINRTYAGLIAVADTPRAEAKQSIERLRAEGIKNIVMFTGDNRAVAESVAAELAITDVHAAMLPEDKLLELEKLEKEGLVGMVGDGVNDAPALSRADIGIAMGSGGTAVTVEAADLVILTDDLSRLPEVVTLAKRTMSVIRIDMVIWLVTNLAGFALVFTGIAGPALASFYNFATDFLPLANSARLFTGSFGRPRPQGPYQK